MAQPPDYHLKLLIGDLTAQIAILRAENERLREQLPQLQVPDDHLPRSDVRPFPVASDSAS